MVVVVVIETCLSAVVDVPNRHSHVAVETFRLILSTNADVDVLTLWGRYLAVFVDALTHTILVCVSIAGVGDALAGPTTRYRVVLK